VDAHQDELTRDSMLALAQQAGLDVPGRRAALDQGTYRPALDTDKAPAAEFKVRGTPAFFVNGHRVVGLAAPADFRAALDRAPRSAELRVRAGDLLRAGAAGVCAGEPIKRRVDGSTRLRLAPRARPVSPRAPCAARNA
jgi:hypothetical protein